MMSIDHNDTITHYCTLLHRLPINVLLVATSYAAMISRVYTIILSIIIIIQLINIYLLAHIRINVVRINAVLMISICASDLMTIIFEIPIAIDDDQSILCMTIIPLLHQCNSFVKSFTIISIAIDQYRKATVPLHHISSYLFHIGPHFYLIVIIWLMCFLCLFPYGYYLNETISTIDNRINQLIFIILFQFIMPFIVIIVSMYRVWKSVNNSRDFDLITEDYYQKPLIMSKKKSILQHPFVPNRITYNNHHSIRSTDSSRSYRIFRHRLVSNRLLIIIYTIFMIGWLPFNILTTLSNIQSFLSSNSIAIIHLLAIPTTVICNSTLYIISSRNYRFAFGQIFIDNYIIRRLWSIPDNDQHQLPPLSPSIIINRVIENDYQNRQHLNPNQLRTDFASRIRFIEDESSTTTYNGDNSNKFVSSNV